MQIRIKKKYPPAHITSVIIICMIVLSGIHNRAAAQDISFRTNISRAIQNPSDLAKSWVFWYWMYGSNSQKGITADLEAMKEAALD